MKTSLHAYYFGANAYTLVPAHIETDLAWMAEHGTRSFALAVIEDFLVTGKENITHIARMAEKFGLEMDLVPSFVCGLVAGAPHVPCPFVSFRPDLWVRDETGAPRRRTTGPMGSIHHPEVFDHFVNTVESMLQLAPFRRLIWDEPKCFVPEWFPDSSEAACRAMPEPSWEAQLAAGVDFFSRVNDRIRASHPSLDIWLFDEAFKDDLTVEALPRIRGLDAFGCDGRPWRSSDSLQARKSLIDQGHRFINAAAGQGLRSFALIENHKLRRTDMPILDQHLGEVLSMPFDHLIFYYYPNGCEDPDGCMAILGRHLDACRSRHPVLVPA